MNADSTRLIVTASCCHACDVHTIRVHHQHFPELELEGVTARHAADHLVDRLTASLDSVSDSTRSAAVRDAIADIRAFLHDDGSAENDSAQRRPILTEAAMLTSAKHHTEVIDTRPRGPLSSEKLSTTLARTESFQVVRLVLTEGKEIPTHQARGEITVHCLEGRIAFTVDGVTHDVKAGQLLVVAAGKPHSLRALEDAIVLVTKSLALPAASDEMAA